MLQWLLPSAEKIIIYILYLVLVLMRGSELTELWFLNGIEPRKAEIIDKSLIGNRNININNTILYWGWIPKELIGRVESMCKETLNGLKGLDISLICFQEKEISSSFTKISAVIKIITPNN